MVWNVRVLAVSAKKDGWRPGIMLGTGSVRIGDSHQSLYLQLFKSFEISENFTLSLNSGVATLFPDFNKAYVLAGASVMVYKKFSAYVHYDGRNFFPRNKRLFFESHRQGKGEGVDHDLV